MLIIFDLDDTLIQTTESITLPKLRLLHKGLVFNGLDVNDPKYSLENLEHLNAISLSAKEALSIFLKDLPQNIFEQALDEIYGPIPNEISVELVRGVTTVLPRLKFVYKLFVITLGKKELQLEKMKKAGMDFSIFSNIIVTEGSKKPLYQKILENESISPQQIVVCGDRVERDLLPGKELGFSTVLMKQGRGKILQGSKEYVDYEVNDFYELENILKGEKNDHK